MGLLRPFGPRAMQMPPEAVQLFGYLRAFERPATMPVAQFRALNLTQLQALVGKPASEGGNILVNAFYIALFNVIAAVNSSTAFITANGLSLGSVAPATVTRTDSSLTGSELKRVPLSNVSVVSVDPPNVTLSYFSAAADGAMNIGEAALWTSAISGQGQMISHLGFSYNRPTNQDVLFAYTLTRSLT